MPSICPGGCSRLASAAVFISVGVVQFVVGIILLRSKYVFLLSGPDFWTSGCNIAVGSLLGVSASVWKQWRKRDSKKHVVRRNLLLSLLFSGLIINATTLGIFLLGEGNTLLSIRLESGENYGEATFASEVLAYAYVTSVCSPIVCIVVSIVAMSGSCFSSAGKNSIKRRFSLGSLKKNRSRTLQWVYSQEPPDLPKKKSHETVLSEISESSSDDDSDVSVQQKPTNSVEELQSVLSRMAQGKRDSVLSDSTIMLRELDLRRKSRHNSLNQDGSYLGPSVSRLKESTVSEKPVKSSGTSYDELDNSKTRNQKKYSSEVDENTRFPSKDISSKGVSRTRNKRPDMLHRNAHSKKIMDDQDDSQSAIKNTSSQNKNFREKRQVRPEVVHDILRYSSTAPDYTRNSATTRKKSRRMLEIETDYRQKSVSTKPSHRRKSSAPLQNIHELMREKRRMPLNESNKHKEISQVHSDDFSPDGSDFSPDAAFESSRKRSSWAGEIVSISTKSSSLPRPSRKLIPVASPVIPNTQRENDLPKLSDDSGISSIQSTSFSCEIGSQGEFKERERNLTSFRENPKMRNKEIMLEYPKVGAQSVKKYDLNSVVTMASISEEPNIELNPSENASSSVLYETTPKTSKRYFRQQSLPSVFPGLSKESQLDEEHSKMNITPKRKRSLSGKALRKLWSVSISDNHTDFLDQVVDDDSLIGLSEEQLVARQAKNRSIRKAVQQRIKEEMLI